MDVTTETDTTGAFYGQIGQITTDTDSGTDNNFLLRAPIAIGERLYYRGDGVEFIYGREIRIEDDLHTGSYSGECPGCNHSGARD